jgi:poly-beta-1,6-N-acetyl-D-glucosamine synthase
MRWLFWAATGIVAYTYFGYAGWLSLRKHWRRRPVRSASYTPYVSIVLVVRNEAEIIEDKIQNLLTVNYPQELREIIVVSDGSTDGTNEMISRFRECSSVRMILKPRSEGKAAGLNDAVLASRGEIVVFTDARQQIEPDAIARLAEDFADPSVGCSSGELMLGDPEKGEASSRMGLYWRIEKKIRELESASGSVVGATGALYAARRELIPAVPPGTILDDVFIPMNVVRRGFRVVFNTRACAWDLAHQGEEREFSRKVRTLTGNYQLVQLAPWLLSGDNPLRFEFVSHKLLRLLAPFALITALISSAFLPAPVYRVAFFGQLLFYTLCLLANTPIARGPVARLADAAYTFVVLNLAATMAFANFVIGRKAVWEP